MGLEQNQNKQSFDDVLNGKATLRRGQTGPAVEELQKQLNKFFAEQKFWDRVGPNPYQIKVDGKFGPETEKALVRIHESVDMNLDHRAKEQGLPSRSDLQRKDYKIASQSTFKAIQAYNEVFGKPANETPSIPKPESKQPQETPRPAAPLASPPIVPAKTEAPTQPAPTSVFPTQFPTPLPEEKPNIETPVSQITETKTNQSTPVNQIQAKLPPEEIRTGLRNLQAKNDDLKAKQTTPSIEAPVAIPKTAPKHAPAPATPVALDQSKVVIPPVNAAQKPESVSVPTPTPPPAATLPQDTTTVIQTEPENKKPGLIGGMRRGFRRVFGNRNEATPANPQTIWQGSVQEQTPNTVQPLGQGEVVARRIEEPAVTQPKRQGALGQFREALGVVSQFAPGLGKVGTVLRVADAAAQVIDGETGILEALGKTALYGVGGRIIDIDVIENLTRSAQLDREIDPEKEPEVVKAREDLSETINNAQDVPPEEYEAEIKVAEEKYKEKEAQLASVPKEPVGTAVSGGDKVAYRNGNRLDNVELVEMEIKDYKGRPVVLDQDAAQMFSAMVADAKKDGVVLQVNSSFRTQGQQQEQYTRYLTKGGFPAAKPGYSKHQSGMALDIQHTGTALAWLQKNAKNYGFTQPLPKTDPVHWEFNGTRLA